MSPCVTGESDHRDAAAGAGIPPSDAAAADTPDQVFDAYLKKKDKERAEKKAREREAREKEREARDRQSRKSSHDRDSRWVNANF